MVIEIHLQSRITNLMLRKVRLRWLGRENFHRRIIVMKLMVSVNKDFLKYLLKFIDINVAFDHLPKSRYCLRVGVGTSEIASNSVLKTRFLNLGQHWIDCIHARQSTTCLNCGLLQGTLMPPFNSYDCLWSMTHLRFFIIY